MSATQIAGRQISALAGDISGGGSTVSVDKIKGTSVSATAPTTSQVLTFDGSSWSPQTPSTNPYDGTGSFVKTNTWLIKDVGGNPASSPSLAYDGSHLWMLESTPSASTNIAKVDLTGNVVARLSFSTQPTDLIFAFGYVWVAEGNNLHKVDPTAVSISSTYSPGQAVTYLASNATYIFTSNSTAVLRFDPVSGFTFQTVATTPQPDALVTDGITFLWLIDRASSTITRVDFMSGSVLGTVDVSAHGFPVNGIVAGGYLWVTMTDGNLLQLDSTGLDTVVSAFPSGASSLSGIVSDGLYFLYVTSASPSNQVFAFDYANLFFVLDVPTTNSPADVVWDGADNLWAIDRTTTSILRYSRSLGTLQGTTSVSASGSPRRGVFDSGSGDLWVTMSSGDLLQINTSDTVVGTFRTGSPQSAMGATNLTGGADATYASITIQDILYTASTAGAPGNLITITYTGTGTAGSEVVSVSGNTISVDIEPGVSTASDIVTAVTNYFISNPPALVSASTSNGSNPQTLITPVLTNHALTSNYINGVAYDTFSDASKLWTTLTGGHIWAVGQLSASVDKIDSTGAVVQTVSLGGSGGEYNIAYDGAGFMWVTSAADNAVYAVDVSTGSSSVIVSSPAITNQAYSVAFDGANMWVGCYANNTNNLFKVSQAGVVLAGPISVNGIPVGIAYDQSGNVWVTSGSNFVTKVDISTYAVTPYSIGTGNAAGIAYDGAGFMWVTDQSSTYVYRVDITSGAATSYSIIGSNPLGIAYDGAGKMWTSNYGDNSVSSIDISTFSATQYTGGGLYVDQYIALGGGGVLWVSDNASNSITKIAASSTLSGGLNAVAASLTAQDVTYTANTAGSAGNSITVEEDNDGVFGSETVTGGPTAFVVHIAAGNTRAAQVVSAVNNPSSPSYGVITASTASIPSYNLSGITQSNGTFYVSDPAVKNLFLFTVGTTSFGPAIPVVNTPDDIAWDATTTLWSIASGSSIVQKLNTSGSVTATLDVSAYGLPRRLGPTIYNSDLWITMDGANIVRADGYGPSILENIPLNGPTTITGITNAGGVDFYLSAVSPDDTLYRFVWDGADYMRIVQTEPLANQADSVTYGNGSLWAVVYGDPTLREVSLFNGTTQASYDISAYGNPNGITQNGGFAYIPLASGYLLKFNIGVPAVSGSFNSGESVLGGISEFNATQSEFAVGFTSPSDGYLFFSGTQFIATGTLITPNTAYRMAANATDLWVASQPNPTRITVSTMAIAAVVTGTDGGQTFAAILGSYVYFDSGSTLVQKVDPGSNSLSNNIGLRISGGGAASSAPSAGIYSDGTSLWAPTLGINPDYEQDFLDRVDSNGRIVAEEPWLDWMGSTAFGMIKVGSALFVRASSNLHRLTADVG